MGRSPLIHFLTAKINTDIPKPHSDRTPYALLEP
jgi:hypothetical protein